MATQIFVNLPVKNLPAAIEFFKQLGYNFNEQFTDDTAACMVISDTIYAMLLTYPKFSEFTSKQIADATQTTEVLTALSMDSKEAVNAICEKAIAAGGSQAKEPYDYGFMYGRSINDLDGHIWEYFWMDPTYVHQPQPASETSAS
jgi:uncharacterized protein